MVRRIMSDAENERQKQRIRSFLHNGRRIEDAYPQIEKIEINYLKEHNSFVGHNEKDGKWTLTPHSEMYFVIDCLNRECTSIGYDLSSVVGSAIRNHETEVSGTMRCQGNEAPDHPEQSCDGSLSYTIRIIYKK
jgi:hypothetical protein